MNLIKEMKLPRDLYGDLSELKCLMNYSLFERISLNTTVPNTDAFESIAWLMFKEQNWFDFTFRRFFNV